jgi:hypothetical protein
MKPIVYLSGPITRASITVAGGWRRHVAGILAPEIICLDPLRGMYQHFKDSVSIPDTFAAHEPVTDRAIMRRDHFDCLRSNLVFCNLIGATEVSKGTIMELAWAYDHHIPVIAVLETSGNLHEHPMVRESFGWRFSTLDPAVCEAQHLLLADR